MIWLCIKSQHDSSWESCWLLMRVMDAGLHFESHLTPIWRSVLWMHHTKERPSGYPGHFILGALGPLSLNMWGPNYSKALRGLWATSVPSLYPVVIGDFLLEVTEQSDLRRRRRRTRQLQNIYACTSPPVYLWCWNEQACRSRLHCGSCAPHQRKAQWLPCLLRKSRSVIY